MRSISHILLVAGAFAGTMFGLEGVHLTADQMKRYDRLTHELIAPCCWREPIAIHRSPEALQILGEVETARCRGPFRKRDQKHLYHKIRAKDSCRPTGTRLVLALRDSVHAAGQPDARCTSSPAFARCKNAACKHRRAS